MNMGRWILLAGVVAIGAWTSVAGVLHMSDSQFDAELQRRFQYPPPAPEPPTLADPAAGQAADAAYLEHYPDYERSYTDAERREARALVNRLEADATSLTHEQFVLRVAEIAALADNGHTAIGRNAFMKNSPRLPLRTYPFADGLYVVLTNAINEDLLGARIDRIDGRSIDDIYHVIRRYRGGTEAFRRRQLLPMLESPALLHAAGVAGGDDALTLTGVLFDGRPFNRRVAAEQRDRAAWVSDSSRLIFPDTLGDVGMHSLLHVSAQTPLYLHSERHVFWIEPAPAGGLYVDLQFNGNADEGPIGSFLESVLTRVRAEHPNFIVLDMRMNGGGDYTTSYGFARALPAAMNARPIYVITSGWTFSAAITTTAALKEAGGSQVTIVGEPVGDRLRFWAEGGHFTLPNSFLVLNYTAGMHVYDGPCADIDRCFWLNWKYPVRVRTLAPDVYAPLTFVAYRQNRDPAMEAVLRLERRRNRRQAR